MLEHVPDDKKAISEIYRVLKKDGWAILQVPLDISREVSYENPLIASPEERLKHFGQEDHVRIYGRDYYQRIQETGFKITSNDFIKSLSEEEIKRYSLMKDEFICYVTK